MKFIKKTDLIIVLVIISIGILLLVGYRVIFGSKSAKAEIYYKSTLVETVPLDTGVEKTFSIPQNSHVVFHLYKDGRIGFEESDCPDKICIKTGKLKMVGETAACLPNEIFLKIVPAGDRSGDEPDMIIGK